VTPFYGKKKTVEVENGRIEAKSRRIAEGGWGVLPIL
jgi:hypothetical protein